MTGPAALVTGATGWLGARLVLALSRGLPDVPALRGVSAERLIRCLAHRGEDTSGLKNVPGRIEAVSGDVTDPESLEGFVKGAEGSVIFHCSGVIHPTRGIKQFYAVNVEGVRNLIEAARDAGVRRLVHVSSNSPFGFNPAPDKPFDESSPFNPYMNYGKSKKMAEDIINAAGEAGGIETVIIRPPWFYGPGQPLRQTRFFSMIKNGSVPVVGGGENRRSMAYVDNICQALMLCERVPEARGRTYWIADRWPYTLNEIIDTIERVMEKEFDLAVSRRRRKLPGLASGIAQLMDGAIQAAGFYQQEVHVLSEMNRNIFCSISRAEDELGYDPKIELYEGMRRSIKWLLDNGGQI